MTRRRTAAVLLFAGHLLFTPGCFGADVQPGARPNGASKATVREEAGGWPDGLVANDGHGPALFMGRDWGSASFGYVSAGVPVRVVGVPSDERIPVRIDGGLKVRGWMSRARLGARVVEGGQVEGTPIVLGRGDLVRVLRPLAGGRMEVEVGPDFGRGDAPERWSFVGTYPTNRLGVEVDDAVEDESAHTLALLPRGREVPLHDRPRGKVAVILPALDPPLLVRVIEQNEGWTLIHVGVGPYLRGYVNSGTVPPENAEHAPERQAKERSSRRKSSLPMRLQMEAEKPLWKVRSGTRVEFDGSTIALLERDGLAREFGRHETIGMVDVFVAVDEDVAVRGLVPADALSRAPRALAAPRRH